MSGPVFFGVRHLSPAAAFHLRKALDEAQPELVLVEGPSDLNDQMEWLPETQFPAAILAYTQTPPVRTVLWPFAVYSPEVQAILWAHEHKVECRFMDLPSAVFLAFQEKEEEREEESPRPLRGHPPLTRGASEEEPQTTESVYRRLETLTGEEHDTFWERRFEQTEDYQAAANAFGRELRAASEDGRRDRAENIVREAYMKRVICQAIDAGIPPEKIFCVCGAFHVAGLEENAPMTDGDEASLPRAEACATLMPYSYYRLSTRSGYGAGNKAPAYFELLWDALNGEGLQQAPYLYLTKLAAAHRKAGNLVSSAEVIEAVRLADTLAGMRGSKYPALADLRDASVTTMGHGSFSELALAVLQGLGVDAAAISDVAETASRLSLVVRYGDLRRFDPEPVIPLVKQLYLRACLTLADACICDAQAAPAVTQAMDRLNALQLNHDFLERDRWVSLLEEVSDRDDLNTRCSGFAMAILLERGEADEALLSREVARRLSPGIPADLGAGWFEGLAGKNRYALIARLGLWRQLDGYLTTLDDETFRRALVFLRRAFADFSPKEKNDIAENLGEIWGVSPRQAAELLMNETTEAEQAVLDSLSDFDFDDI